MNPKGVPLTLALKYRPKHFKDLIGQESVSNTLSLALDHARLAHAYLFSGLRGSGKTSTTRIFARALQCEKGPSSIPCDSCLNCLDALKDRHLDIIEIDGASNRRIEDVRNIIEQTKYKPSLGRFKIFMIDEAHMLTKEAFNALLKTLEEPPAHVKFILATTDPHKLPATILSRTQHFHFKKIAPKAIVQRLQSILDQEGVSYEQSALEILARSGGGSLRDTLTLSDQAISYTNQHISAQGVSQMLGMVNTQILEDFFKAIVECNEDVLKDMLKVLEEYEISMVLEEMGVFLKEAVLQGRFSLKLSSLFIEILARAKELLYWGADGGFVLALSALKMQASQETSTSLTTPPPQPSPQELFTQLIKQLYQDNQELGKVFERFITFHSFSEGVLKWHSRADEPAKKILNQHYYDLIMPCIQKFYGKGVKIEAVKVQAKPETEISHAFMQDHQELMKAMQENLGTTDCEVEDS
ncbi:DNA polymerase III subunit gamma/tau [Helicobacter suis]|uniref:DNA polymerase III subunit gamma/tau n=1 Tax=Helicobacter suis TaxID=104628 RepID=UPI0013D25EC0